jgi:hypothetical protein
MTPDAAEVWEWYEEDAKWRHISQHFIVDMGKCEKVPCIEYRERRRRMKEQNAS